MNRYLKSALSLARFLMFAASYLSNYRITPKPWTLIWGATYRCNSKCKYCERPQMASERKEPELTTDEVKKLADELADLGLRVFSITGGEPLLKKDFFDIGRYITSKGIRCQFVSNGSLITQKNIQQIIDSFETVIISLDSLDPEVHDSQRGMPGSFKRAMQAIDLLSKRQAQFGIQTTMTRDNIDEVIKLMKFTKEKGGRFLVQPVNNVDLPRVWDKNLLAFDFDGLKEQWDQIVKDFDYGGRLSKWRNREYLEKFPLFLEHPAEAGQAFICYAGSHNFYIDPYGDVFLCETLKEVYGNVRERPLKDIWRDMREARQQISSSGRKCVCWYNCTAKDYLPLTKFLRPLKR